MIRSMRLSVLAAFAMLAFAALRPSFGAATVYGPRYAGDGSLVLPSDYRTWTYLTTGFDMSYNPMSMAMGNEHNFGNVFVSSDAYRSFVRTGTWPDKTVIVLEHRRDGGRISAHQQGSFESAITDIEVHVKDEARFRSSKWAFFGYGPTDRSATMIATSASCYRCHAQHAAVDTTFVQFYPTLLPIATSKGTLSAAYRKNGGP